MAAAAGALLCLVALVLVSTSAGASPGQVDPAYGSSGPPPPEQFDATCSASPQSVPPGGEVTITIDNAAPSSSVTVTLDGDPIGSGTTDAQGHASITFAVPSDTSPGPHQVAVSGAGFSCALSVDAVLSGSVDRGGNSNSSGGSLAFTGIQLALLLAVAVVLLIFGWQLLRSAHRRRKRLTELARSRHLVS